MCEEFLSQKMTTLEINFPAFELVKGSTGDDIFKKLLEVFKGECLPHEQCAET